MKKIYMFGLMMVMVLALAACGGGATEPEAETEAEVAVFEGPVKFADAGWDSLKFNNAVAAYIIETGYGVETDIIPGSSAAIQLGLKDKDLDVLIETWSDNIEQYDEDVASGAIIEIKTIMEDNMQGFYVPTYVIKGDEARGIAPMAPDLKTVEDLKKYPDLFVDEEDPGMGRIYNAPPGWMVAETMETKTLSYGLDEMYNLFSPGSDAALAASIVSSYEKGEPWIGYYWEPTWVTGLYDLTLLEEAEYSDELWENGRMCSFKPAKVTITVQNDFPEQLPEITEFLSNYNLNSRQIAEALAYMSENEATVDEAAMWFLEGSEDVWTTWVDESTAQKVKDTL